MGRPLQSHAFLWYRKDPSEAYLRPHSPQVYGLETALIRQQKVTGRCRKGFISEDQRHQPETRDPPFLENAQA